MSSGELVPSPSLPMQILQQTDLSVQYFRDTHNIRDVDALHGLVRHTYCSRDVVATRTSTLRNISTSSIPQRIVQIGRSKLLSSMETKAQEGVLSWLLKHPCYDYVFLDDAAIEAFFAKMHPRYLRAYNSLVNGGEKADLTRYIYMHASGGIYADTDTHVVRSAEDWNLRQGDSFVVGLEADFISDAVAHEWVYARPRSASLHTFAVSPGNPLLSQVIETVVRNIESPNNIYDEVYSRGIGLPSHLETIFKTGPGPFSDVVLGPGAGNSGTSSHPHTRVLGLWGFSGKHSQGSKFYIEQKRESRADKTVYVEHMNLGSWLKPYPKFKLAGNMDAISSGTSLVGGEWIAAIANERLLHSYDDADPVRQHALWCHGLGSAMRNRHQGFLHLRKDGTLSVGLGKGPLDPEAIVIFSKDPQIKFEGAQVEGSSQPSPQKEIFDLHLDRDGVLSLSLLTMPAASGVQSMSTKHLWSLPDHTTKANGFVRFDVTARKSIRPTNCAECSLELILEAYPRPQICVYPTTLPSEKSEWPW